MRVAVLGAGNGGLASAFDFAQHGHEVALYARPEYGDHIHSVDEAGGITAAGQLEGFAPVRYAGYDAAEALDGAELALVVGPAYATEPLAADAAPHLADGTAVLVCPGSCAGAIAFKRTLGRRARGRPLRRRRVAHAPLRRAHHRPGRDHRLPQAQHVDVSSRASRGRGPTGSTS